MKHPKILMILAIVVIITFLVILETNRYAKQSNPTSENYDKFGQKTNLLDKSGRISHRVIYKSIYHWVG